MIDFHQATLMDLAMLSSSSEPHIKPFCPVCFLFSPALLVIVVMDEEIRKLFDMVFYLLIFVILEGDLILQDSICLIAFCLGNGMSALSFFFFEYEEALHRFIFLDN